MLYNDDETRKNEEKFQQDLILLRSITEEDNKKVHANILVLQEEVNRLAAKEELTAEEIEILARITSTVKTTLENINRLKSISEESIERQANAYYQHVKKLAEEGNEEARKVYEQLRPSYQASLINKAGEN